MSDYKNDPMKRLVYKHDVIVALTEKIDEPIDFVEALKNLPVVDAVEVVLCKDCKYWNDMGLCKKHSIPISGVIYGTDADDYCSEGKPKEQEHE